LLSGIKGIKNILTKIQYKKPSSVYRLIIFFVFSIAFALSIYFPYIRKMAIAETREMLYAFFIMFYAIFYIWYNKERVLLR